MNPGDALKTIGPIRSQKTGLILPREGKFVGAIENLGRTLILVNFGNAGDEYLFPNEVLPETVHSPSPNTSQLAARVTARRTLRSLGEGGWKGFGEFRKDASELCSEELH